MNKAKKTILLIAEFIWEMFTVAVTALVIVFLVKSYVFEIYKVDGQSMEPTLHNSEILVVEKLSYLFSQPSRGDIIVFQKPSERSINYIKRIIGLPGEKIMIKDNHIYVVNNEHPEGFALPENYLPPDIINTGNNEYTIEQNQYFVLGDNRTNSQDSRVLGPISKELLTGKSIFSFWPISEATWFFLPDYQL